MTIPSATSLLNEDQRRKIEVIDRLIRDLEQPAKIAPNVNFLWLSIYVSFRRLLKKFAFLLAGMPRIKRFLSAIGARHVYLILRHGRPGVNRAMIDLRETIKSKPYLNRLLRAFGFKKFSALIHRHFFH